jgi:hypothetical protein
LWQVLFSKQLVLVCFAGIYFKTPYYVVRLFVVCYIKVNKSCRKTCRYDNKPHDRSLFVFVCGDFGTSENKIKIKFVYLPKSFLNFFSRGRKTVEPGLEKN